MAQNVFFKKGLLANLPSSYAAGTFYVTTDEKAMYLDIDDSTRIRLGDFQEFATLDALKANVNPSTTAMYYIDDLNVLAKWNGTEYIQINTDTGVTSVEVVGEGNAVTAASYDATTRKLTLTMGETFATKAEFDAYVESNNQALADEIANRENAVQGVQDAIDALDVKVGDIPEDATATTVIGYVDEKVVAINSDADSLAGRVKAIEDDYLVAVDKTELSNAINAEKERAEGIESGLDNRIKAIEDDYLVAVDKTELSNAINAEKERAEGIEAGLAARIKVVEDDYLVEADKTELSNAITAEKERAEGAEGGLDTRIKAIEDDYLVEADKTELAGLITAEKERAEGVEAGLQTQINTIMNNPDTEGVINSINEFTQYIADHGQIAEGFRADIDKNKEDIAANAKAIADQATSDASTYETKTDASDKLTEAKGYADGIVATEKAAREAKETELAENIEAAKTEAANHAAVVLVEAQRYADQAEADAIATAESKVNTLASNVYTKEQTYTQEEVNTLLNAAISWGEF